ncbi:MAG: hypothetical protein GTO14_10470 [Anaerolineales bacterium]|nr:hypothetical protein [Anaerolineales bacterium]
MLTERIIGAFTFRTSVYAEVENDTTFTTTAWMIVAVVAFFNQLGTRASSNLFSWLAGTIVGTIFALIGFAIAALIISWVGRTVFYAEVNFDELVRTLGLAYVWNILGVFGAVVAFSEVLQCVTAPAFILAWLLGLIAWFVAAKEALDLEWVQTIVTVVVGWIAFFAIMFVAGLILGVLGLSAAALGGFLT